MIRQIEKQVTAPAISVVPRIFSPLAVQKLNASNRCIRWLREHGVSALAAEVLGDAMPTVVVPAAAAPTLKREAFRKNLRCMADNAGGTVFMGDCALTWRL